MCAMLHVSTHITVQVDTMGITVLEVTTTKPVSGGVVHLIFFALSNYLL